MRQDARFEVQPQSLTPAAPFPPLGPSKLDLLRGPPQRRQTSFVLPERGFSRDGEW